MLALLLSVSLHQQLHAAVINSLKSKLARWSDLYTACMRGALSALCMH